MKNTKRSAFTIVELVIVIAVIAILSAVLIPTFGAIIKDANVAADQTAAATLTTELHVDLMGETIDSEAELMERIAKIDEKKLTPKAAAYGVHFWFDMDNQMILAKTAKEIEDLVKEKNAESAYVEHTGVQLINDAQPAAAPASLNINFRSLLGGNFFLIDKGGSAFVNALNKIAEFSGTSHADLVADVNGVFVDVVVDDQNFVDKFKAALASTVIITENVVLQPATATNVYFDPGIRFINDHDVTINISSGVVDLPDTVIGVAPGALVFGSTDVVLNTACKDASDVEFVFANASTNATIKTEADSYKIADGAGNVTVTETEGNPANKIVPVSTINNGVGTVVPNITLSNKLTCTDFSIYAEAGVTGDNAIAYNIAGEVPTLYVSYNEYVKGEKEITLSLLADDGETVIDGANSSIKWDFCGENLFKNSITDSTTVTASAKNINGEEKTHSLNIVVVKINQAVVNIGGDAYDVPNNSASTHTLVWDYDGENGSRDVSLNVASYLPNVDFAHGTHNLSVDFNENGKKMFTYDASTKKLTVITKGTGDDAYKPAQTGDAEIYLNIDGYKTATVKVTLNDITDSPLVSGFYFDATNDPNRNHYYVGNGPFTLGNILKERGEGLGDYEYTVSIEVPTKDNNGNVTYKKASDLGWKVTSADSFTGDAWKNIVVNFSDGSDDEDIRIKIAREGFSDKYTLAITLRYVADGVNVTAHTDVEENNVVVQNGLLQAATKTGTSVVMMSNITIPQGVTAEDYGLEFTTDETLYGNGFVLSAKTFIASASKGTGTKASYSYVRTCSALDSFGFHAIPHSLYQNCTFVWQETKTSVNNYVTNEYLISLNGATVDNIYIDGPVYAGIQYDMYYATGKDSNTKRVYGTYADTPFYVSGIKTAGSSTIKNSYVSGFRSPVAATGTLLTISNSTIRGGNYANIDLVDGNLTMTNVITVQDQNGQQATVDADGKALTNSSISVVGAGIMVGKDAVQDSIITISGYFNQYNWIKEKQTATMPNIDGIDLNEVFGWIFDGVPITDSINLSMNRTRRHTHEFGTTDTEYVNAGIIYAVIGTHADINGQPTGSNSSTHLPAGHIIDNRTNINGTAITDSKLKYTRTELETFSNLGTASYGIEAIDLTADKVIGKDGKVIIYSRIDGRTYKTGGYLDAEHPTDIKLTNADIIYDGYYDGDGSYAAWYNASANDHNK